MPRHRFVIYCSFGCQEFTLKEDGSTVETTFRSIIDALTFVRRTQPAEGTQVAILNPFGAIMMETVL
jgi:hypothetical protein